MKTASEKERRLNECRKWNVPDTIAGGKATGKRPRKPADGDSHQGALTGSSPSENYAPAKDPAGRGAWSAFPELPAVRLDCAADRVADVLTEQWVTQRST